MEEVLGVVCRQTRTAVGLLELQLRAAIKRNFAGTTNVALRMIEVLDILEDLNAQVGGHIANEEREKAKAVDVLGAFGVTVPLDDSDDYMD